MSIAVFGHGLGWQELSWSERGCGPLGAVPECQGRLAVVPCGTWTPLQGDDY